MAGTSEEQKRVWEFDQNRRKNNLSQLSGLRKSTQGECTEIG